MGGDEDGLVTFEARDGDALEWVEGEGIGLRHWTGVERVRESSVNRFGLVWEVTVWNGYLVDARA